MNIIGFKSKNAVRVLILAHTLFLVSHVQAQPRVTLQEAEQKMVRGGYLETLQAAYWAAREGEALVPILAQMLGKEKHYQAALGGSTGAFPFNALWALAHIPGDRSRQALEQYLAASQDQTAALALKGHRLRQAQQSSRYGIVIHDTPLLSQPREQAPVVREISSGQQVKIVQERIINAQEEGPRGGPSVYDRVELLPGGERGYIQRAGDGFTPFI